MGDLEPSTSVEAHRRAFDELVVYLRQGLCLSSKLSDSPYFDHALQRIAQLYGEGTYENLSVSAIFESAIQHEALLVYEYQRELKYLPSSQGEIRSGYEEAVRKHLERAQALIDATKRARNLEVQGGFPHIDPYMGVYIQPLSEEIRRLLLLDRTLFISWKGGALAALKESSLEEFKGIGASCSVLYLDSDEMVEQTNKKGVERMDSEFSNRLERSKSHPQQVGDQFLSHVGHRLLKQSTILHNLQVRLEIEHPSAHQYCAPILEETKRLLECLLKENPFETLPMEGTLSRDRKGLAALEESMQKHAEQWKLNGENGDCAGLLFKFDHFLAAGVVEPKNGGGE